MKSPIPPNQLEQVDLANLATYNFDHPDAFDTPLMLKVIQVRLLQQCEDTAYRYTSNFNCQRI